MSVVLPPDELQLIVWLDSFGGGSWGTIERERKVKLPRCVSVGFVIFESDEAVTLVPHWHPADTDIGANEGGCGDMTIPKCAIVHRVGLSASDT